jgi:uncharacterized membrane protein YheB (UPF0754 family)
MTRWIALATVPLVGAFVGWVTNVLAIWMLFHPRRPVRVLGLTIQGLIPRRRRELADAIARTVAVHLVTTEDLYRLLSTEEVQGAFTSTLEEHIGNLLRERLWRHAVLERVFTGRVLEGLQRALAREVMRTVPDLLDLFTGRLEQYVSISEIVKERLERFEEERIEALVRGIAERELKAIELWGGVLGFAIGLIQSAVWLVI